MFGGSGAASALGISQVLRCERWMRPKTSVVSEPEEYVTGDRISERIPSGSRRQRTRSPVSPTRTGMAGALRAGLAPQGITIVDEVGYLRSSKMPRTSLPADLVSQHGGCFTHQAQPVILLAPGVRVAYPSGRGSAGRAPTLYGKPPGEPWCSAASPPPHRPSPAE